MTNADSTPTDASHDNYDDSTDGDAVAVAELQRHRNGDETAVLLCDFGGGYQALALDVDAGGQILEVEEIGADPDRQTAEGMISYWTQQHPDGVLGAVEDDESGGLLDGLFGGDGA